MTASTPPLVDVIAGVLAQTDDCDKDDYSAQACAVLDALSEAGGVEVVTGYGVKLKSGDVERCGTNAQDANAWLEAMKDNTDPDYGPVEVVTRTTTTITIRTDWTAVEGS